MQKNVAGQKWTVFAFDRTTNEPKPGDAANITANLKKDDGADTPLTDINPVETEDGFYDFDISQTESNAVKLQLFPESVTSNIQVIAVPGVIWTDDPYSGGAGNTAVNHNTGGTDALRYMTAGGAPIDDGQIKAYLKTAYDAGDLSNPKAYSNTGADGRWTSPMMLDTGIVYTLTFYKPGYFSVTAVEVTP